MALDECWEWKGARNNRGYGHKVVRGKLTKTHRLAYQWAYGAIPHGLHVLHRCDNPPCCNPEHLFLGTHAENMADMKDKGRAVGSKGQENHTALLSEEQVREIRFGDHGNKYGKYNRLADRYDVSRNVIARIVRGETWKHISS